MKDYTCDGCGKPIKVREDYEPEFCCSGYMCGCYGMPLDPAFCYSCELQFLGKEVEVDD